MLQKPVEALFLCPYPSVAWCILCASFLLLCHAALDVYHHLGGKEVCHTLVVTSIYRLGVSCNPSLTSGSAAFLLLCHQLLPGCWGDKRWATLAYVLLSPGHPPMAPPLYTNSTTANVCWVGRGQVEALSSLSLVEMWVGKLAVVVGDPHEPSYFE